LLWNLMLADSLKLGAWNLVLFCHNLRNEKY